MDKGRGTFEPFYYLLYFGSMRNSNVHSNELSLK